MVTAGGFGGAVLHVMQVMEHVAKQGHRVALVASPEPRLMERARASGVTVFPNNHFVRPIRIKEDIRALWVAYKAIKSFRPD